MCLTPSGCRLSRRPLSAELPTKSYSSLTVCRPSSSRGFACATLNVLSIPNGVDTKIFRPERNRSIRAELGISDDTALIGAIGNIRKPKAYDVLLRAARALADGSRRFHLVIAGDRANTLGRDLEVLKRNLGLDGQVTFLGLREDVPRVLNNLDVFVLSSHTEGFSIACIEAMACGIPVVATRSGVRSRFWREKRVSWCRAASPSPWL